MKHVGTRANAKDIVSQEQLSAVGDFMKDGSVQMTGAFNEAPIVDLASASNLAFTAGDLANTYRITGNTDIANLGSCPVGAKRTLLFTSILNLTTAGQITLLGSGSITTAAGDSADFISTAAGFWSCLSYTKKDGTALVSAGGFRIERIATTSVGQTSYTVPNGYIAGQVLVWFNGALLDPVDYTATNGTTVVLASGAVTTSDTMSVGVLSALRAQDDALLQYTVAALPSASANAFKQRWCTNMAGRPGPVYSDGTNWRRYVDDSIVTV